MLRGSSNTAPVGTPSASSGTSLRSGSLDAVARACKSDRRYGCPSSGASSDGHGMFMARNAIRAASSDCCSERAAVNSRYAGVFMLMRAFACHVLDACMRSTTILRAACHVGTHPPVRGVRESFLNTGSFPAPTKPCWMAAARRLPRHFGEATALNSSRPFVWISRLSRTRESSAGDKFSMHEGVRNAFGPPGLSLSREYSLHGGARVSKLTLRRPTRREAAGRSCPRPWPRRRPPGTLGTRTTAASCGASSPTASESKGSTSASGQGPQAARAPSSTPR